MPTPNQLLEEFLKDLKKALIDSDCGTLNCSDCLKDLETSVTATVREHAKAVLAEHKKNLMANLISNPEVITEAARRANEDQWVLVAVSDFIDKKVKEIEQLSPKEGTTDTDIVRDMTLEAVLAILRK